MPENYFNYDQFDTKSAEDTGGVTGSKKVKGPGGVYYQLKSSILDNSKWIRKAKARGVDIENLGEVIATEMSRAFTNSDQDGSLELAPKVSLVHKPSENGEPERIMIASRYLSNVEKGTIDEYAKHKDGGGIVTERRHVKVSGAATKTTGDNIWDISGDDKQNKRLRKDIATAIAISALSADHDVNPGNMMVVKDSKGQNRIARIDFGHAFNDLISYRKFGGRKISKNQILDFVNRETVNKFPAGDTSKLWRDYEGIVPSQEMVLAFKKMSNSTKGQAGIDAAKKQFQDLVTGLGEDAQPKTLEHIKKSLVAINNNVSNKKINPKKVTVQEAIDQTFENLDNFYKNNQEQMRDVSKLMDIQVKIDQIIMDKKNGKEVDQTLIAEIKKDYKELENNKESHIGKGEGRGINWVKNSKDKKAFKGNLSQFIRQRSEELGLGQARELLVTNDFSLPKKRNSIVIAFDEIRQFVNIAIRGPESVDMSKTKILNPQDYILAAAKPRIDNKTKEQVQMIMQREKRQTKALSMDDRRRSFVERIKEKSKPKQGPGR